MSAEEEISNMLMKAAIDHTRLVVDKQGELVSIMPIPRLIEKKEGWFVQLIYPRDDNYGLDLSLIK
jgi:hypothetical protein